MQTLEQQLKETKQRLPLAKVDVPEGDSGLWRIERFTVTEEGAQRFNFSLAIRGGGHRSIVPGVYTKLQHSKAIEPMMSDTPAEMWDHREPVQRATGRVLIMGLGIGLVVENCLRKPDVAQVTVIERDPDVIALVAPHYRQKYGARFRLIQADALEFRPAKGEWWDVIWHDIWPTICADNLPEMATLKRRFARRCDWQGCWSQEEARRYR